METHFENPKETTDKNISKLFRVTNYIVGSVKIVSSSNKHRKAYTIGENKTLRDILRRFIVKVKRYVRW